MRLGEDYDNKERTILRCNQNATISNLIATTLRLTVIHSVAAAPGFDGLGVYL
jgi:hypothetical protein